MKTETTIRHARNAVGLIVDGAIRRIESDYGPDEDPDRSGYIETLFDAIHSELDEWDVQCDAARRRAMCDDMIQLMDSDNPDPELMEIMGTHSAETVRDVVEALLIRHGII